MPNPDPVQSDRFKARQYQAQGEIPLNEPLAKNPTKVKLPVDAGEAIRRLPEPAAWLRKVIVKAAQEEGLI